VILVLLNCGLQFVVIAVEHPINPTAGLFTAAVETLTTTKTVYITMSSTAITQTTAALTLASAQTTLTLASTQTALTLAPAQTAIPACARGDDDDDDAVLFVSIGVVVVGVLLTIIIVVVGVILCRRDRRKKKEMGSTDPLIPKKNYGSVKYSNASVGVENDLYGRPEIE